MSVALLKGSDLEKAATMDDLDAAAKHLQDIAGITTGDVAGQCLDEKKWAGADKAERIKQLQEYVRAEAAYEEAD